MAGSRDALEVPQPAQAVPRQTTQVESRMAWERVMGVNSPPPVEYGNTSVLILGWDENADDTRTAEELVPLQEVLQGTYGFSVQYKRMHMRLHPQVQATKHVADFVYEHDGPRGLLIIYYAGHGWAENDIDGRISLAGRFPLEPNEKDMSIEWTEVEYALGKTTSDVLVIFDCCHAGLLCRPAVRGHRRSFYYVAACKGTQMTKASGEKSFTTAMIWALKEMAHTSGFTVTKLVHKLMEHEPFPRHEQEAVVYPSRFGRAAHEIWIAPKHNKRAQGALSQVQCNLPNSKLEDVKPTANILDLRLHFSNHAPPDHIEETARVLKSLLETEKALHFHRITFIDHTSFIEWPARHWLQMIRERRSARDGTSPTPGSDSTAASFSGRYPQLPVLRTSGSMSRSAVSSTAVASPASAVPSWETETMREKLIVTRTQILTYHNVRLGLLVGCVAVFGICGGGFFGLTWAFGDS